MRELPYSLDQFYERISGDPDAMPQGLAGALRAIFEDLAEPEATTVRRPASALIKRMERELLDNVYRWTGHFPEKTRSLMRHLAGRAEALKQVYPKGAENEAVIGVTILVTSLAMNHVHRGSYFPETQPPTEKPPAEKPPAEPVAESAPASPPIEPVVAGLESKEVTQRRRGAEAQSGTSP